MSAACLVCGKTDLSHWADAVDVEYLTGTERFGYWLCADCDTLSIDPVPADRLGEIYPADYYSFAGAGESGIGAGLAARVKGRLDRRTFERVLAGCGSEGPNILDVGGGTGEIAAGLLELARSGARATVVDIDGRSEAPARGRGLGFFAGRIEDFETDERFDLVLMLNLIEHVADPVGVLEKAGSLLRPGGVIWLQTPNFRSLDARLFRHRNWAGYHCPRHWAIFSEAGFGAVLARAGLRADSLERTQAGAFWAASILGLLRRGGRKPLVESRWFFPLAGAGAAFDLATRRLRPTSQIVCLARKVGG